ncbi:hypothetical protein SmJEL517_g00121 [Synchytrium microbalum]|uniref:Uncharacterized protein n=1 Tax=Synchytrium microbalum TaxID=1806994 RepID=A0A507CF21_9FUNG|nr:uncharacterized protein SmJEL517_g00121 [Synchytrium microbalum]TPX38091.1 hypothetical protein SmJEL517_g00121 [Synchytrium microbalum]
MPSESAQSVILGDDYAEYEHPSSLHLESKLELLRLELEKTTLQANAKHQDQDRKIKTLESQLRESSSYAKALKHQLSEKNKRIEELLEDTVSRSSNKDISLHEARLNNTLLHENAILRKRVDVGFNLVLEVLTMLHTTDLELISAWAAYAKSTPDTEAEGVSRLMAIASSRAPQLRKKESKSDSVQTDDASTKNEIVAIRVTLEAERTAHSFEIQAHRKTRKRLGDQETRFAEFTRRLETIIDGPQLRERIQSDSVLDIRSQGLLSRVWDLKQKLDICISDLGDAREAAKDGEESHRIVANLHEKHIEHLRSAIEKITGHVMSDTHRVASTHPSAEEILEAEASYYHDRIDSEIGMLRQEVACLKNEKEGLELQLRLTRESMVDHNEWCELLAQSTINADELKKYKEEASQKGKNISLLHERIVHLNNEIEIQRNEICVFKESSKRSRAELSRKDTLIKEVTRTRSEVDDAKKAMETRCKGLASSASRLERECREMKSKLEKVQMENTQLCDMGVENDALRDQVTKLKQEIQRKEVMIDRWKIRAEEAQEECSRLRETKSAMIEPALHATALEARKSAEARVRSLERELERSTQQMSVLERAMDRAVNALANNCSNNDLNRSVRGSLESSLGGAGNDKTTAIAKDISEKLLGLDYHQVFTTPGIDVTSSSIFPNMMDNMFRSSSLFSLS